MTEWLLALGPIITGFLVWDVQNRRLIFEKQKYQHLISKAATSSSLSNSSPQAKQTVSVEAEKIMSPWVAVMFGLCICALATWAAVLATQLSDLQIRYEGGSDLNSTIFALGSLAVIAGGFSLYSSTFIGKKPS